MFAFDEFGPLGIRPTAGSGWAPTGRPYRLPANYSRTHGIRYFHGCYSVGDDTLWGVNRHRKGIDHTWAALRSIRRARPDGAPIYVILDNLSAHKNWRIRRWARRNRVELCFTPTYRAAGRRRSTPAAGTRLRVVGEIDQDSVPRLRRAVGAALSEHPTVLHVDLARVPFSDSTGLHVLLDARARIASWGGTLTVDASDRVRELLRLTETTALFTLTDADPVTVKEAV